MPSSIRAAVVLSIFSAVPLLAGCPDPQGRFDEYVSKIPDAAPITIYDSPPMNGLPDITGTFLLAIKVSFVPDPIQTLATVTMTKTGATATANFHIQFLDLSTRTPIATPTLDVNNIAVSDAGDFTANVGTLMIPSAANPLLVDATAENVTLPSTIKTADLFCGTVTGNVTKPTPQALTGSTYAAIRITAGQTGTQLPDPVSKCP